MTVPENLLYSDSHEWIKVEGDVIEVGITHFAQQELGEIIYIELPELGTVLREGDVVGILESVKAVSDTYSPCDGEVIGVNDHAIEFCDVINKDPYEEGWLYKVKLADKYELNSLLDAAAYKDLIS